MRHLTEQEQIDAHYDEVLSPELTAHLETCESCSADAAKLASLLLQAEEGEIPEPSPDYESRVWNRLQWQLEARPKSRRTWRYAAAALLLITIGFLAGQYRRATSLVPAVASGGRIKLHPDTSLQPSGAAGALTAQARDQVDRSSRLLMELANQPGSGDSDMTGQREAAENLLASNRLYRATANRRGDDDVSQLLGDIEPILLELAHAPESLSRDDLIAIQKRIESRELLFKLRVLSSTLRSEPSAAPTVRRVPAASL
jgi:hypothetical protein